MSNKLDKVVLGGGCFWCLDAVFRQTKGVVESVCGYAGGSDPEPNYGKVCTGTTGHAEVVQVTFDPAQLPIQKLLSIFFTIHNPTTPDQQGADIGNQYRSIMLYTSEYQREAFEAACAQVQQRYTDKVITEVVPLKKFYKAEDYHQNYFENHSEAAYCQVVIAPKLKKLQEFQ